jgi:hypothetical protein
MWLLNCALAIVYKRKSTLSVLIRGGIVENEEIVIGEVAFESPANRGFTVKATYLKQPAGDALIEVFRDGQPLRWFLFPAYKVWNIAAHFSDIVDSELAGNKCGYDMAAWTGFTVIPTI